MKKMSIEILILVITLNYSCKNTEIDELKKQISNLELKNNNLKDSIDKYKVNSIVDYQLTEFPELNEYKINETGIINFGLLKYGKIRKYNVYQKIKGSKEKKLIYSNLTDSHFKFEFTPKSIDDNEVELLMEFKSFYKDQTIVLFTKAHVNVVE